MKDDNGSEDSKDSDKKDYGFDDIDNDMPNLLEINKKFDEIQKRKQEDILKKKEKEIKMKQILFMMQIKNN